MERSCIEAAQERIRWMELYFDTLQKAVKADPEAMKKDPALQVMLEELSQYYENGLWLRDYEMDEAGLLPGDLKRGVLAQDAVYDFLQENMAE